MKDLPLRILGAILVVVPTLFFIYLSPTYFFYYLLFLNIGAVFEWSLNLEKDSFFLPIFLIGSLSIYVGSSFLGLRGGLIGITVFLIISLLLILLTEGELSKISLSFLGITYISLAFSHIFFLREMKEGLALSVFFFSVVWLFDVFSYFGGSFFGSHLLAPAVSPKKTWEGFFSGLVGALLVGSLFYFLGIFTLNFVLLSSCLIAVFSLLGDLIESKIKRYYGVKDSGRIYLGHGGVFDRFDAALFSSIAFYYFLRCF
jgi:phosphatidate cytidylyltransferase